MDLKEITDRLTKLEAQVSVLKDIAHSERAVLFALLHVLHSHGVPLPDVIARIEQRSAFGQAAFREAQPETLAAFLDALRRIATALPPSQSQ